MYVGWTRPRGGSRGCTSFICARVCARAERHDPCIKCICRVTLTDRRHRYRLQSLQLKKLPLCRMVVLAADLINPLIQYKRDSLTRRAVSWAIRRGAERAVMAVRGPRSNEEPKWCEPSVAEKGQALRQRSLWKERGSFSDQACQRDRRLHAPGRQKSTECVSVRYIRTSFNYR